MIKFLDKKFLNNSIYKFYINYLKAFSKKVDQSFDYNYRAYYNKKGSEELAKLCDLYGCDNGYYDLNKRIFFKNWHPHTYADFYSNLFDHCKQNIKKVFECGIGTSNENIPSNLGKNYKPGASLKVWKDYFKNATIYGADIDKDVLFKEERIKTFYVDQLDKNSIKQMWIKINEKDFDLIIDDGLHSLIGGITLLEGSFEKLRSGGIYIIENIDIAYLDKFVSYLEKKFNFNLVFLKAKKEKLLKDNNLIVIRKD